MKATPFELAVARVTGETLREIRRRGFSVADLADVRFDPEPDDHPPQIIDWDQFDSQRSHAAV